MNRQMMTGAALRPAALLWRMLLLCSCALLLASCSGGSAVRPAMPPVIGEAVSMDRSVPADEQASTAVAAGNLPVLASELPALPADPPRSSSAPPSDDDRLCLGSEWQGSLASGNVAADIFTPQFAGAANRNFRDDAAYAIYRFSKLADYPGKAQIRLSWNTAADTPQDIYIALSNYTAKRWEWHRVPASMIVSLADFGNYTSAAQNTYVLVASLDNGTFILDYLLAGTNIAPVVDLQADLDDDPLKNIAPLVVGFDARATRSFGGSILSFDFDWEGDGNWDVTGDTDGLAIHQFAPGSYQTQVRATDNMGLQGLAMIGFTVIDPDNQPPVASFTRNPTEGEGPLTVQFDASGSTDAMGGEIIMYEWDFITGGDYEYVSDSPLAQFTFSMVGANYVTLRVTDNDLATHTVFLPVNVSKGWRWNKIYGDAEIRHRIAVTTVGGGAGERAAIAFSETENRDVHFLRANNTQASSWSGLIHPVPTGTNTGYSISMDAGSSGVPIIAYGKGSAGRPLYIVSAEDESGTSWNPPVLVDNTRAVGFDHQMRVINTTPCIAALNYDQAPGISEVLFYKAKDGLGGSWFDPVVALQAQPGVQYGSVSLGMSSSGLFRRPVIAAGFGDGGNQTGTAISAAGNIDGTSWNLPVLHGSWTDFGQIIDINGRPAYCSTSYGVSYPLGRFSRALDGNGSSWPQELSSFGEDVTSATCLEIDGRAVIYYQEYHARRIVSIRAVDADASSWEDPVYVWPLDLDFPAYMGGTVVDGKPVLAYSHRYPSLQSEVRCLSWY